MDMNKKITITEEEFLEASAKVIGGENLRELISHQPVLLLFATALSMDLARLLFREEETKEKTAESESEGEN